MRKTNPSKEERPGSVVELQTSSFADCVVAAPARWWRTTDRHFSGVFTWQAIDDKNRKMTGCTQAEDSAMKHRRQARLLFFSFLTHLIFIHPFFPKCAVFP